MQVGMIGLGRMGMNIGRRLLRGGHEVAAYNRTAARAFEIAAEGAQACSSLSELAEALEPPRVLWLMLPAGNVIDRHLEALMELLAPGDTIVDGGNTSHKDDLRRAGILAGRGIEYVDAGVSGGIWGLENGYCLMIGGDRESFARLEPLFRTLAPVDGYLYCGPTGAGHYIKMVHNGIEYGLMQAYAEGFALLEASDYAGGFDYARLAKLWNQGSVIRSWLLELLERAFGKDRRLDAIRGYVEDSGEGRWMVQEAVERGSAAPVIALALFQRFASRQEDGFAEKILAALRHEFGGHALLRKEE